MSYRPTTAETNRLFDAMGRLENARVMERSRLHAISEAQARLESALSVLATARRTADAGRAAFSRGRTAASPAELEAEMRTILDATAAQANADAAARAFAHSARSLLEAADFSARR